MYAGATYLVPSGPNNKMHLHVVLVDPDQFGSGIWVSVCSIEEGIYNDDSCEFLGGEHEFIDHPSFVAYSFLSHVHQRHVERMLERKAYIQKDDVTREVLTRILAGLGNTDEAPKGIRKECLERAGV